ncbi:MAG: murein hydrolase activator EnvC family protein, partial [Vulcanimicrobiota bacterium]
MVALQPGECSSLSWKKQQLYNVRSSLRSVKKRLEITNVREKDMFHQLHQAQNRLRSVKGEVSYLNNKIKTSETDIKRLRSDLERLKKEYDKKQVVLQKRLRQIYLNGENSFAEVVLCSQDFSDFVNRTDYLKRISESDEKLIKSLKLEQQAIAFKENQIQDKYTRMLSYRGRLKQKKVTLESIEEKREVLLHKVEKERKFYLTKKWKLEEHTYELEQEVQTLIREYQRKNRGSKTYARGTGTYNWPADGVITSNFGWRVHPIYGNSRFHTGIDIGAYHGSGIRAADSGNVIYSGWCGGYGYTVMIDHGRGVTTLYGHCSELYVNVGQAVSKGDTIAAVGST